MTDRPSILVVDDELGPRESLRIILKPSYEVSIADNGQAALDFLERHPVDLITLDLKMPGLSGLEVLEQVRQTHPDVMVIVVTGYGTFKSVVEAIRFDVFDYISKPFSVPEIRSVVKRCLEMRNTRFAVRELFTEIGPGSAGQTSGPLGAEAIERMRGLLGNSLDPNLGRNGLDFLEFARTLSNWIEKRDPHTIGHSERVVQHTNPMAHKMELSDSVRKELQIAAYLHDIGKISISSRFMNTEGKLSSTDWAILKRHPIKSVEMLEPLELSAKVISAIRHHHERFDGTGYPDGLAGSQIPLEAQIISIANMYDLLTSKMAYRNAMSPGEPEVEIRRNGGSCFDPKLTRKFLRILKEQRAPSEQGGLRPKSRREAS